jgi:hypothetical protein
MAAMSDLAGLLDLAANVVRSHPDAPDLCSVACDPATILHPGRVQLQLSTRIGQVRGVAEWAVEWRTAVLVQTSSRCENDVRVAARIVAATVGGPVDVEVWTFVDAGDVAFLGMDLPIGVEVPVAADVVLSRLDSTVCDDHGVVS